LFSDDFETGTKAAWTTTTAAFTVQSTQVHNGAWAGRAKSTGAAAAVTKTLAQPASDLYYRVWFKVISRKSSSAANLLRFSTANSGAIASVFLDASGVLSYTSGKATRKSTITVTAGAWHQLQVRVAVGRGQVAVWYDAAAVTALTRTESLGTTPVAGLVLGDDTKGRTFDIGFDDVLVSTQFVN
jgi:hypothetical protein